MPEEGGPPKNPVVSVGKAAPGIEKIAGNQYNVDRKEVDKALQDLNKVLTEARAVPNFENGVANGYKLFQIVPGSIYDKLGLQNGDVISGLNGAAINDPGKAFEMLSDLKTSNHLELQVQKNGKVQNYIYDIR
jgi:general secretion pathway protein C